MAVTATQITNFRKDPVGNGRYEISFLYTGPASYTSGGEVLTRTVCRQAMQGISQIDFLIPAPAANTTDFSTFTDIAFQPINDGTNVGKIHLYNEAPGHTHDMLAKGGLTSSEALFLDASQSFGKTAATDRTIVGSTSATTGGVVAAAAGTTSTEASAATNYSGLASWFFGFGVA